MTLIRIDPNELSASAATLRSCAVEIAEIGSQLASCVCCPMPPDLAPVVDGLVGAVDRALDSLAVQLNAEANDLSNRATLASSDLATATQPVRPMGVGIGVVSGTAMVIGGAPGFRSPSATVGGFGQASMTIGGASPAFATAAPAAMPLAGSLASSVAIGGVSPTAVGATNPFGASNVFGTTNPFGGTTVINPLGYSPVSSVTLGGQVSPHVPNSTAPGALGAFNLSQNMNATNNSLLDRAVASSRPLMESQLGAQLSSGEYYNLVPGARPSAGSMLFY